MKIAKLTYNSSTGATAISGDTLALYDEVELEIEGLTTEQMSGLVFEISTKSYVTLLRTRGFTDSKKTFTLNSRALMESFNMINPSGVREFFAVGRDSLGECLFTGVMQIKNRTDYPTYIYESIAEHYIRIRIGEYANASHTHADYAIATHNHDAAYSALNHTHDYSTTYAALSHTHSDYSLTTHTHDYTYVLRSEMEFKTF